MFEYYLLIFIIFVYLYYFYWITKLEKLECKCSDDFRRSIIKYGAIVLLIINVFSSLFVTQFDKIIRSEKIEYKVLSNLMFMFLIFYIYVMYSYSNKFIKEKELCKCLGKTELLFIRFHALFIGLLMSFRVVKSLCL